MAGAGEQVEITALLMNLTHIIDIVTAGGIPHWFAHRLVEKAFIHHWTAQVILACMEYPVQQAEKLLESVFAKIHGSRDKSHWFNKFVDIFSYEKAYQDLVKKLRREGI